MFENWTIFSCGQFDDHVDLSMGFTELPVSGLSLQSFWPILYIASSTASVWIMLVSEYIMRQNLFLLPPCPRRTKENGFDREPLHSEHPSKRPCTISPGQRYSPNNGLSYQPNGLPHPTPPPPQHYRLDDMAIAHHYRDSYRHPSHRDLRDRNRPLGKTERFVRFLWDWVYVSDLTNVLWGMNDLVPFFFLTWNCQWIHLVLRFCVKDLSFQRWNEFG